jgi:hypothetical protein
MVLTRDDFPSDEPFALTVDNRTLNPPVTTDVSANSVSQEERLTDQCGNAEIREVSDGMWQLDVTAILLKPDLRLLHRMDVRNREVTITQDVVPQTTFRVKDITINRTADMNLGEFPNREVTDATRTEAKNQQELTRSKVYEVTLQTKDPSNNESSEGGIL